LLQIKLNCAVIPYKDRLTKGDKMRKIIFAGLIMMTSMGALAQDMMEDGSRVVLPLGVQSCKVPNAPPPIPESAAKEDLINAKKLISSFQGEMLVYRTCMGVETEDNLDALADNADLTQGNVSAILLAYDYSVTKEEQVAKAFNEALKVYKAGLAK
jgi:hypothetical protein